MVLLATPDARSPCGLSRSLLEAGVRVVDLSGAFRLKSAAAYPRGLRLRAPGAAAARPRRSTGCRSSAAQGSAGRGWWPTPAASPRPRRWRWPRSSPPGSSPPRRWSWTPPPASPAPAARPRSDYSFVEVDEDIRAYRVLRHQHAAGDCPDAGRRPRGARRPSPSPRTCCPSAAASSPPPRPPAPGTSRRSGCERLAGRLRARALRARWWPAGGGDAAGRGGHRPRARVGVACAPDGLDPGRVVVISALGQPAARARPSQAVQNLNAMLGLPETPGLARSSGERQHERPAGVSASPASTCGIKPEPEGPGAGGQRRPRPRRPGCFTVRTRPRRRRSGTPRHALPAAGMRAVLVNSGNANALTGRAGVEDVRRVRAGWPSALEVHARRGAHRLHRRDRRPAAGGAHRRPASPALVEQLGPSCDAGGRGHPHHRHAPQDGRPRRWCWAARGAVCSAICKGSGMIAPQLATMIARRAAPTPPSPRPCSHEALAPRRATEASTCLTVDGDMSTNDIVFALANGLAGQPAARRRAARISSAFRGRSATSASSWRGPSPPTARAPPGCSRSWWPARPTRRWRADCARRHRRLAAGEGGHLRRRPELGPGPGHGGRAGRARSAGPSIRCRREVRIQDVAVFTSGAPVPTTPEALQARMREPEVLVQVHAGRGRGHGHRLGLRPLLRLREDQRRLHLAHRPARRRRRWPRTTGSPTTARPSSGRCWSRR